VQRYCGMVMKMETYQLADKWQGHMV
jgi:hypothetical protein